MTKFKEAICDALPESSDDSASNIRLEKVCELIDEFEREGKLPKYRKPFASDSDSDDENIGKRAPTKQRTSKKSKKPTDPNAPKGVKSSYLFFCDDARKQVKEEQPDLAPNDVSRKMGDMWRKMTDEDKEPYKRQAEADKTRYATEMESYRLTM